MTASPPISHSTRFVALEQADFQRLEHAGYLKGLLQPFKGKGSLETWASQCAALRDDVIGLAQRRVLPQARAYTRYSEIHTGRATWGQFGLTVAVGAILLVVGIWLLTKATGVL